MIERLRGIVEQWRTRRKRRKESLERELSIHRLLHLLTSSVQLDGISQVAASLVPSKYDFSPSIQNQFSISTFPFHVPFDELRSLYEAGQRDTKLLGRVSDSISISSGGVSMSARGSDDTGRLEERIERSAYIKYSYTPPIGAKPEQISISLNASRKLSPYPGPRYAWNRVCEVNDMRITRTLDTYTVTVPSDISFYESKRRQSYQGYPRFPEYFYFH